MIKYKHFYIGDIIIILIKGRYTIVVKAKRTLEMCEFLDGLKMISCCSSTVMKRIFWYYFAVVVMIFKNISSYFVALDRKFYTLRQHNRLFP